MINDVKETELSVWVALSKENKVILFTDEPHKSSEEETNNFEWIGNLYINSIMYNQIERMIKQSDMTHQSEPEQLIFTIKS